ncbi:MAG: GGDEF domain-containing protein [Isosphaerales bacterium]
MNHSTWSKPMSDALTPDRAWRFDPAVVHSNSSNTTEASDIQSGADAGAIASRTGPGPRWTAFGCILQWHHAFRTWLRTRLDGFKGANAQFEDVLHHFAATIATVDDPAIVEAALLRLARKLAPACRIELVPGQAPAMDHEVEAEFGGGEPNRGERPADRWTQPAGQAVLEVPLRCGASVCGRLRLRSRSAGNSPLRSQTIERLTTLCTMAASAMECLGHHAEWPRHGAFEHPADALGAPPARNAAQSTPPLRPSILLQDATFLHAVLPFALNQARRHREPLSLLCVAIDRRNGVQELLGRAEVDRLIRHVGEITCSLIRTSDIVARLDDDRVVVVLPRAPRGGALHVAENICHAVAEKSPANCNTPNPTVSIGVATFPSCADNVYSLFDAADEALAWAQNHGRNQAVLAPSRPGPAPSQVHAQAVARSS